MKPRLLTVLVAWTGLLAVVSTAAAQDAELDAQSAIEREDYALAAKLLREELEQAPENESVRFLLARVLGWSGDFAAALAQYDTLIAASAHNVDYSFGRAQVLAWTGRDAAALEEVARARSLAPSYEAVWRLELNLLRRGTGTATRLAELREQAARRFPGADWWADAPSRDAATPRTELTFVGVHQSLSRPVPDWSTLSVRVTRRQGTSAAFYGALEREQRFGRGDVVLGAGGSFSPAEQWTAGVDLGLGTDVDFMPSVAATGWATRAFRSGWETGFRLRHRRYDTAEVTSTAATVGRYFGKFRAAYTLDRSRLHGEAASTAHSATLNYYHSERLQLDLTLASGQEAEVIAPGRVLRTDVTAFSLGARHDAGDRWRVSWWAGAHRQGELYRRRYVGLSVSTGL